MISVDMIILGAGSVLAYAFDASFAHVKHGWRYMVGIGAVPSIVPSVFDMQRNGAHGGDWKKSE